MKSILTFFLTFFISFCYSQEVYFSENFDDCVLPAGWTTETDGNSQGWTLGNSTDLSSEKLIYPDLGSCFIGNNDDKWDDATGDANQADNDYFITPFIDFSESDNLVMSFDYISGYSFGILIEYRTENTEWKQTNVSPSGGVLKWQQFTRHLYGDVNSPIKDVSSPLQFRFRFSDHGITKGLGVGIDNLLFTEGFEDNMRLETVHIPSVVPVGTNQILPVLFNRGANFIYKCKVSWQLDDQTIQSIFVEDFTYYNGNSLSYMYPFGIGLFPTDPILVDFPESGTFNLKVWIDYEDNMTDQFIDDNYFQKIITVKDQLPEKNYIYEKFSHNTCPPCYEADLFAKELEESNENVYVVSVHSASSDPMDYPLADIVDIAYSQRAHPGTILDRRLYDFLPHGRMSSLGESLPELTIPWWSPVDIQFVEKVVDESTNTVYLKMEATFYAELDGEFRFNIFTLEDGIKAYQSNAPEGADYIHNHVLRNYTGGNWGTENSLPTNIYEGETYTYEATIEVDASWEIENLDFIGVVQHFEQNDDNREIINAKKIGINDPIIVDVVETQELQIKAYPNPATNFIHLVSDEFINSEMNVEIISSIGRSVFEYTYYPNGQNYQQIDLQQIPAGNYFIHVNSDNHLKSIKPLVIIR